MDEAGARVYSRERKQRCLQKLDLYANPVTLTYNNQKKFTTVHGGLCTVISIVMLFYLIGVAVVQYLINPEFVHTFSVKTLD